MANNNAKNVLQNTWQRCSSSVGRKTFVLKAAEEDCISEDNERK